MPDSSGTVEELRRQQAALATFGSFAFREDNLQTILTEAARACACALGVPHSKICQYRAAQRDLVVVAGYGWKAGIVGHIFLPIDKLSTQGRTFVTGDPVTLEDISEHDVSLLPSFYAEHGILSTADVIIKGKFEPWGVLEIDSTTKRKFNDHDNIFLTSFANIVADAVTSLQGMAQLNGVIAKMKALIREKDELIVQRKASEFHARELQRELLHVSRLNAMGQMTAAIAHELNQPIAAIANYVNAAKRMLASSDADIPVRATELLEKAQQQSERAGAVVRNLKDAVAKRESRRLPDDIGTTIKDSLALVLFGASDAEIDVKLELDDAVPPVLVDRVQIQQILINLLRNSIESMAEARERILTLSARLGDAGFVHVTVCDTGVGLLPSISERLFQPFNTSKSNGMGLGLTICQALVEANGGRIWQLADMPQGTGFCFSLPIAAG